MTTKKGIATCLICKSNNNKEKLISLYRSTVLIKNVTVLSVIEGVIESPISNKNSPKLCKKCLLLLREYHSALKRCNSVKDRILKHYNKVVTEDPPTKDGEFDAMIKNEDEDNIFTDDNQCIQEIDECTLTPIVTMKCSDDENEEDETSQISNDQPSDIKAESISVITDVAIGTTGKSERTKRQRGKSNIIKTESQSAEPPKLYICEICGSTHKKKFQLLVHVGMHNGVSPYSCEICKKNFTQKVALKRHTPIHTGEYPFVCDTCGRQFKHRTSLIVHKATHGGGTTKKCELCGLVLKSSSSIGRHMKQHTGEKKYECHICGKRFAERYNLTQHIKRHKPIDLVINNVNSEMVINSTESVKFE